MSLPSPDTPLYNHSLPKIEQWLIDLGCQQDTKELNFWYVEYPTWKAQITLEIEELTVNYIEAGARGEDIKRAFKYFLTRQHIEEEVFGGP